MIKTISNLLEEIRKKGIKTIEENESNINHRPTIGNIYEGLTKEILNKGIFNGLNLFVVANSFIYNDRNELSDEIDCMIVEGKGTKISFTNQFKYHFSKVIAVIQVKKNLFSKDIHSAHWNLNSVKEIGKDIIYDNYLYDLHYDSYKILTSKDFPTRERVKEFTFRENAIYSTLMMEAYYPVRIVISYYGI